MNTAACPSKNLSPTCMPLRRPLVRRNKKLLAQMGSIPDDADFFDEVKKIKGAAVNAAAAGGGSSAGT